ncbi:MAG: protein phosphatase 2C domain-containing protein [Polyangiaceae bacterium]
MTVRLTVSGRSDTGRVRTKNEDSFVVADLTGGKLAGQPDMTRFEVGDRGVLLAVSDGMGGEKAGEVASALVVQSLERGLAEMAGRLPDDALLEQAVMNANRTVWEAAHASGREKMGATLTALYVHGSMVHIAEVGDSRAFVVRGGTIQQVTRDQSYVQLLIEAGAVSPEAAEHSPMRGVILQAMGREAVRVALGRLELRRKDCFVLCSDGLSNKVATEEIRDVILAAPSLDEACVRLIDMANQRGGEDNITVIVAGVSGDLPAMSGAETIDDTWQVLKERSAARQRSALRASQEVTPRSCTQGAWRPAHR